LRPFRRSASAAELGQPWVNVLYQSSKRLVGRVTVGGAHHLDRGFLDLLCLGRLESPGKVFTHYHLNDTTRTVNIAEFQEAR
jgi:hypothetical protein